VFIAIAWYVVFATKLTTLCSDNEEAGYICSGTDASDYAMLLLLLLLLGIDEAL